MRWHCAITLLSLPAGFFPSVLGDIFTPQRGAQILDSLLHGGSTKPTCPCVTKVDAATLSSFAKYTQFARAAYCPPSQTHDWSCGAACDANSNFIPTLTSGDGAVTLFFYVGYNPDDNSIVVGHQGTDPFILQNDLTDINILMTNLDKTLFPGADDSVEVHKGFATEHMRTGPKIMKEVWRLITIKRATSVVLVGHSLGGAIAELDTLMMKLNLPSNITVKGVVYGTPRVGNRKFAGFFDSKVTDFTRINNKNDFIPIVPGRFLGFSHPKGEVHLLSKGNAIRCPGDDNDTDPQCTISTVPTIFNGSIIDHLGPYEGIYFIDTCDS